MPRRPRAVLTEEAAEAQVTSVLNQASAHTLQVQQLANAFFVFLNEKMRKEPGLQCSPRTVRLFIASRMTNQSKRTNDNELKIATNFRFSCGDQETVNELIENARFNNGMKRMAGDSRYMREKVYSTMAQLLSITNVKKNEVLSPLELERRAFFYVLVATGSRPSHVYHAPFIGRNENGLVIQWGRRKADNRRRGKLEYPFAWSGKPCQEISDLLAGYNGRFRRSKRTPKTGWRLHKGAERNASAPANFNVGSNIDAWLEKNVSIIARTWVSTTPRDVMTTQASQMIGGEIPNEDTYKGLFDQTLSTHLANYRQGASGSAKRWRTEGQ